MREELLFTLDDIKSIMKSLAAHFGPECEIVLHDFTGGIESSVVAIENGQVTGRQVGSSITTSGLESITRESETIGDGLYNYFSTTVDGKVLRSSSAVLRGRDGAIRGSVCINQDITRYRAAEEALRTITHSEEYQELKQEVFVQNVDELLDHYIFECSDSLGCPPHKMNKEQLYHALEFLESKGVFRITKAGDRICATFGITKYQLYRQLDAIRDEGKAKEKAEKTG